MFSTLFSIFVDYFIDIMEKDPADQTMRIRNTGLNRAPMSQTAIRSPQNLTILAITDI